MKKIVAVLIMLFVFVLNAIGQTYEWTLKEEYHEENIEAWDINPLEEIIYSKGRTLYKLNNNFELVFTQSEQGFGVISIIDARHSLNAFVFYANQEVIGIVDTTLSFQEGKIDLADLSVDYATDVCYSEQSKRLSVHDEQHYELLRLQGL